MPAASRSPEPSVDRQEGLRRARRHGDHHGGRRRCPQRRPVTGLVAADVAQAAAPRRPRPTPGPMLCDRFVVSRSSRASRRRRTRGLRPGGPRRRSAGRDGEAVRKAEQRTPSSGPPPRSTSGPSPATTPRRSARSPPPKQVLVTGRQVGDRVEIVVEGQEPLGHRGLPQPGQAARSSVPRVSRWLRAPTQASRTAGPPPPSTSTARCATPSRRSRPTAGGTTTASTPRAARSTS